MKVIIAGPRDYSPPFSRVVQAVKESGFEITEVVSGGAKGVDSRAEVWAGASSIPCRRFLPDWGAHGKAGGPIRNREMAAYADALVVMKRKGQNSPGTSSMIREAEKAGMPVYVHEHGGGASLIALGAGAL